MATTTAPKKSASTRKAALQAAKALKLLGEATALFSAAGGTLEPESANQAKGFSMLATAAHKLHERAAATTAKVFPAPAE